MAQQFSSPKRKRVGDAAVPQLQTSILPRFPQTHPDHDVGDEVESPRTHVTGRFQQLNLEHYDDQHMVDAQLRETKRVARSSPEPRESSPCPQRMPKKQTNDLQAYAVHPQQNVITLSSFEASGSIFPATEHKRPKSPSLSGEISDQYWHDSEITGHDPDDPTDDGYGINGIGFKPTPAIAYARSQKRKQQLAYYRSREAREARQKRSERRRGGSGESSNAMPAAVEDAGKAKVKFDDG